MIVKTQSAEAQRKRHLARQAVTDALKKMRETGEAWLTLRGERLRLTNPDTEGPGTYLVHINGGVDVREIYEKDGLRMGNGRHIDPKRLLAWVAERHPRA